MRTDQTLAAAVKGYAWLPDLRRAAGDVPVPLRVLGQSALAICGPAATRFFYAGGHLERHTAVPAPVVNTLFGKGAVHTLDGEAHRARKALFTSLLLGDGIADVAKLAGEAFDRAASTWRPGERVVLFDAAAEAIARGVTRWVGVPVRDDEIGDLTADLVAMVDGFATAGPRHWRALAARRRREQWLASMIEGVRREPGSAADTPLARVALHRDSPDGDLLDARTAAVEVLNIIRPSTAVAWLVTYAGHALNLWPHRAEQLRGDDFTTAFGHEVRRFYPFTPFLGGRALRDLRFAGADVPRGTLVLLDVYGQNHHPELWHNPYEFRPERFLGRDIGEFDLIPQGGGDPRTGHRCPGEKITVALLGTFSQRLAALSYDVPPQNLAIDLSRLPARVPSGLEIEVTS